MLLGRTTVWLSMRSAHVRSMMWGLLRMTPAVSLVHGGAARLLLPPEQADAATEAGIELR